MKRQYLINGAFALALSSLTTQAAVIVAYHTNGTSTATVQSAAASFVGTGITAGNAVFDRGANDAWRIDGFNMQDAPESGLSGRDDVWHVWRNMGTGDPVSTARYESFTIGYTGPTLTFENFTFDLLLQGSGLTAWTAKYAVFASVNGGAFQTLGTGAEAGPTGTAGPWTDPFGTPVTVDISSLGNLSTGDSVEFRLAFGGSNATNMAIFSQGIQVTAIPEPSSSLLMLGSLAGLCFFRRRRLD